MSRSPLKSLIGYAETAAAHLLEKGIGALSVERASGLGEGLMRRLGPQLKRPDTIARQNLARILPPDQIDALMPKVWGNLGRTFLEYPKLGDIAGRGLIEFQGLDIIERVKAEGRGAVFFSGHLANWECLAFMADAAQIDAALMYRAPNNPQVAKVLERCRCAKRAKLIPKSIAGTKEAFAILGNKGFVGFLIDHRYNRGIEVDFLGGKAIIAPMAALMAQRHQCPIIPLRAERISAIHHRITAYAPLQLDHSLSGNDFLIATMQQAMTTLEGWIRERPEQWFWMQRLWK